MSEFLDLFFSHGIGWFIVALIAFVALGLIAKGLLSLGQSVAKGYREGVERQRQEEDNASQG